MKLCFSIMQDINTCAAGKLDNTFHKNAKNATHEKALSIVFSIQRLPLERQFEFIPAHSVLKAHNRNANLGEIISVIERGALQGMFSCAQVGLTVRGIRLKLVCRKVSRSLSRVFKYFGQQTQPTLMMPSLSGISHTQPC